MLRISFARIRTRCSLRRFSAAAVEADEQLAGTVAPHSLYIVLCTSDSPRTLPSRIQSPIRLDLQRMLLQHGGIVNFMHTTDARALALSAQLTSPPIRNTAAQVDNSDDLPADDMMSPLRRFQPGEYDGPVHLYVCTHAERDCRCGTQGVALVDALRDELRRRRKVTKSGLWHRVVVGELAHVGGHKYAANLLVFPHGDWLGRLHADQASELLDIIAKSPFTNMEGETRAPLWPEHWRGRMGLTPAEQRNLFEKHR
ncbi:Sucrase/ferredoxin-like-domain-containing protein [Vararia minispora EC-137]|uniref:Sucrase/ferredoxin-like-domain-containing protein n=1 Tax=Vararia minispora EC-137 TaxID=1314806 RepID=A0ACB8QJY5_9AGAM|nr:Sucrase/ferredoxin-like-domain-containing protein [Vararia minispora EC-137]